MKLLNHLLLSYLTLPAIIAFPHYLKNGRYASGVFISPLKKKKRNF